jgi:PleD family two-component response regulator
VQTPIELDDDTSLTVTVSAGVAQGPSGQLLQTISDADRALYVAKDSGRNRVEVSRLSANDEVLTEGS